MGFPIRRGGSANPPRDRGSTSRLPLRKRGVRGVGRGGVGLVRVSPGVISQMNPGPYRPLCVGGPLVGGSQTNRPSPGGSSRRPMVARPVRYGPVRQKKTFLKLTVQTQTTGVENASQHPPFAGFQDRVTLSVLMGQPGSGLRAHVSCACITGPSIVLQESVQESQLKFRKAPRRGGNSILKEAGDPCARGVDLRPSAQRDGGIEQVSWTSVRVASHLVLVPGRDQGRDDPGRSRRPGPNTNHKLRALLHVCCRARWTRANVENNAPHQRACHHGFWLF